jgi:hypothetical protein
MAKTALTQLQEQIEAIRREAYADGYGAAMRALLDFAGRQAPPPPAIPAATPSPAASTQAAALPAMRRRSRAPTRKAAEAAPMPAARPHRGTNAKLVETVLQSIAPRAARPTEIRQTIQREQGVAIPFTSIRHALGQLEARGAVEQVANSKTWRYLPQGGAAAQRD